MSIKSGFYNAINGDRKYNSDDFSSYLQGIVSDGVLANPGTSLQVLANETSMSVNVFPGKGFHAGHWIVNDSILHLGIEPSDIVLDRIDSVVIVDYPKTGRKMDIIVKKGTPASAPTAPVITRTEERYEMVLANIYIANKTEIISQSMITDTRPDSTACGWVTGLIEQVDTSMLYSQWEAAYQDYYAETTQRMDGWYTQTSEDFDTWLNGIKTSLSTATLLRKYQGTYTAATDSTSVIPIDIPAAAFNMDLDILQVYINGLNLIPGTDYTLNSATQLTLIRPIRMGTVVNMEIFKSIDGSEAITAIEMIETLQTQVTQQQTAITQLRADVDALMGGGA